MVAVPHKGNTPATYQVTKIVTTQPIHARNYAKPGNAIVGTTRALIGAIMTTQATKSQDKYLVVVDCVIVGRHTTKSAAHTDGMNRRRNGEVAFTYTAEVYAKFIAVK